MPTIPIENGFRWQPNSFPGDIKHIGKNVTIRMASDVGIIVDYSIETDQYSINYPRSGRILISARDCNVIEWE